jgi:uncharacterized protein (TIGR00369 family)
VTDRIHESFARQGLMTTIGARLVEVHPGHVQIEVPYSRALTQQHGYFHAAVLTAAADSACGYAAFTLMDETDDVLAVEFKINLLRPAVGDRIVATATVLKSGRTLTVSRADVHAWKGAEATLVAVMTQTSMRMKAGA